MSLSYTFRPAQTWTEGNTKDRRSRYQFRASWQSTLDLLQRELAFLDARNVVIQAAFTESDLRVDGMPRANARQPIHPGVRVSFDSRHGPLTYATDAYEFWQHNVRAIALGLEALRAVDRYGVTRRGEQYKGWRQIEAPPSPAGVTVAQARALIDSFGGETRALKMSHPDHGGTPSAFQTVLAARDLLRGVNRGA